MFDSVTAALLRSAPPLPGLSPEELPSLLTFHYAELVSWRLRGEAETTIEQTPQRWSLEKIADAYELLVSTLDEPKARRSAAFVAATAHQILFRRDQEAAWPENNTSIGITREAVPSDISAALLFLIAEQYADANEASQVITIPRSGFYEARILAENIRDLSCGKLKTILDRAGRWKGENSKNVSLQEHALMAIFRTLIEGVELLASDILAKRTAHIAPTSLQTPENIFSNVTKLSHYSSSNLDEALGERLFSVYAGPRHLAKLLLAVCKTLEQSSLAKIPPPNGSTSPFWSRWLEHRAEKYPFLWPNHRDAIEKGFYDAEVSAVLVLPTGAGKTTVSSLKIAATLARGKRVIFLAPTHALVDQMTADLKEMFPQEISQKAVGSDFGFSFLDIDFFADIEVMTPERCLALLSFASESFSDVGLLVFDECHLLSPEQHNIRRALDGMLCLLAFNSIAPSADMLFLSAMLKNGQEFADWIESLTNRKTVYVDLLWKPSRQARGVVVYEQSELVKSVRRATETQSEQNRSAVSPLKGLSSKAKSQVTATPKAIWGLQHNWQGESELACSYTTILDTPVLLNAAKNNRGRIYATPNANNVATRIALSAAHNGLKTIIFVNTKMHSVSSAYDASRLLDKKIEATPDELKRWAALEAELGNLDHSLIAQGAAAVPHNSLMLRLERELAECMFKRKDGADIIIATPTLSQGLNLPAHIAILAGDKRMNTKTNSREDLNSHELLNAAARAGRAGHLANGVVLLIPEPLLTFTKVGEVPHDLVKKLESILPENDRCLTIRDPLEVILDRISEGTQVDAAVIYAVNRLADLDDIERSSMFDIKKSFAGYLAQKRNTYQMFLERVEQLTDVVRQVLPVTLEKELLVLATQSGLSAGVLSRLTTSIRGEIGQLPTTITGWVDWLLNWLATDDEARLYMLADVDEKIMGVAGLGRDSTLNAEGLQKIRVGVHGWISGLPLADIETILKKESGKSESSDGCIDARELVNNIIPRALAFALGLVAHVVKNVDPFELQTSLDVKVIEAMGTALRLGYDTPDKLLFSGPFRGELSRVQIHRRWEEQMGNEG